MKFDPNLSSVQRSIRGSSVLLIGGRRARPASPGIEIRKLPVGVEIMKG